MDQDQQNYAAQIALEEEMHGLGTARYLREKAKADETSMAPGHRMLLRSVQPMVARVAAWVEAAESGKAASHGAIAGLIKQAGIEECSFLAMRTAINAISLKQKLTTCASKVGAAIEEELSYRAFQKENPALFNAVMRQVSGSPSEHYRTTVLTLAQNRAGISGPGWTPSLKLSLGMKLLELVIEATGPDAREALEAIGVLFERKFDEQTNERHG